MPLIKSKSKQAFGDNVKKEMDAGKPQPQALAIAYSTQRHAKKKRMAMGGAVESPTQSKAYSRNPGTPEKKSDDKREPEGEYMGKDWSYGSAPARKPDDKRLPEDEYMAGHFAEGGQVNPDLEESKKELTASDFMEDDERAESIAEAIMQKRRKFADGGMVDLEANSEEDPNEFYGENSDAAGEEQYDDGQISPQPGDSNETGDSREDESENKLDMVSRIRAKLRSKSGA